MLHQAKETFGGTFEAALLGPEPKFVAVPGWAGISMQPFKTKIMGTGDPKKARVSAPKKEHRSNQLS